MFRDLRMALAQKQEWGDPYHLHISAILISLKAQLHGSNFGAKTFEKC